MKENKVNPENLDDCYHQYLEELQRDSLIIYYYKAEFSCLATSTVNAEIFHKVQI